MSRKIKFRAWDKRKKWMVYDVQDAYDGLWSERNSDEINDHYAYVSNFKSFMYEEEFNFMQYTNLKDKNGVEIYEGDILMAGDAYLGVIEYHSTRAQFIGRNIGMSFTEDEYDTLYTKNGRFNSAKVIGNIYENSELLEVSP